MKDRKIYLILTIISIIFLGIGGTLAVTSSIIATNITQIKSGDLTLTISGGGNQSVSFVPSKCTDKNAIKRTIVAKAVNTSGGKVSFSIGLNITELSDTYKKDTLRYALTTNSSSCNINIITGGNFEDKIEGSDVWLIKNDYDNITRSGNTYTKTYYLYIWLDESETEYFDGNISVKLKGSTSNNPNLPVADDYDDGNGVNTLFYQIESKADKYTRVDFSKQSSEDGTNGIYTTVNTQNGIPVYYYRGAVDNNHVIFANFCWRIVRTTETGGVKLIYDGVPSNGECNNTGDDTVIGKPAFNSKYKSPAYAGYMYGTAYEASVNDITTLTGSIVFGNDATYDASTNTYTLNNTYTLTDASNWSTNYSTVASKYHYTCFNSSTSCQKVNYIYLIYSGDKNAYYFELSDGKKHLDILKEMLDDSTNTTNSDVKNFIDMWYQNNMTNYTLQLEDIAFCNDRSYDVSKTGWNKDYSNTGSEHWLSFGSAQRAFSRNASLICPNINDKFTVSADNGNGALTYPVGMITGEEMAYAGAVIWLQNTTYYLYNGSGKYNWTISPTDFANNFITVAMLTGSGRYSASSVIAVGQIGVHPAISLKKGTILSSGSGIATDPYVVG